MSRRARQNPQEEPFITPRDRRTGRPNGDPFAIPENLFIAFRRMRITFSHDAFAQRTYISNDGGKTSALLTDEAMAALRLQIWMQFRFKLSKSDHVDTIISFAHAHSYHPLREYLLDVQKRWDGVPRLDTWLIRYGGAADTPFHRAVGRLWCIAAVRRARQPGIKFDELPVFEGPQGLGKSLLLKAMATREEWFTDNLPIGADPKEVMEMTLGKWVCELAELAGMQKRETENVKAFCSRSEENARAAYGRVTKHVPRQFICAGTCNPVKGEVAQYLKDPTGNRRFWPVTLGSIDLEALRADVDQLWAEAATREAKGETIRLDPALYKAAEVAQDARQEASQFLDTLSRELDGFASGKLLKADMYDLCGIPAAARHQGNQVAVARAARELSWLPSRLRINRKLESAFIKRGGPFDDVPTLSIKWDLDAHRFRIEQQGYRTACRSDEERARDVALFRQAVEKASAPHPLDTAEDAVDESETIH